ncbi:MlaD family protein [Paraconexibacter antarcticus]|uniref:MlaD family protein n=1 Tax=Paraconexibacter antarcticus TaxID=2949664 RepID=A0ABY5E0J9_9ACTN|nr:MlaD family protein [Paraconexibacter antarcticus]UTI66677.1 MlaD family protein [Paraconexibacter antarcticus]
MTARPAATRRRAPDHRALGAAALAVMALVTYISYHASDGLPLQRHFRLFVLVTDPGRLVAHDPVRVGGLRVGQVARITAVPGEGTRPPAARLELALQPSFHSLPADTRLRIRSASPLGANYLELEPGTSAARLRSGATLATDRTTTSVQATDLLDIFDHATARAVQAGIRDTAAGLAGRGTAVNDTIVGAGDLLPPATRVLMTAGSPGARLPRLLSASGAAAQALGPVGEPLRGLLSGAATTMAAVGRPPGALDRVIVTAPGAMATTTRAAERLTPPLRRLTRLARLLRPAAGDVGPTLTALARTLTAGVAPLRATPPAAADLRGTFAAVRTLAHDPDTSGTLRRATDAMAALRDFLGKVTPAQVQCNVFGIFGENGSSVIGGTGTPELGFELITAGTLGADNEAFQNSRPAANLHSNADPINDYQECETGNEPYVPGQQILSNPPGRQSNHTRVTSPPAGVRERLAAAGLLTPTPPAP